MRELGSAPTGDGAIRILEMVSTHVAELVRTVIRCELRLYFLDTAEHGDISSSGDAGFALCDQERSRIRCRDKAVCFGLRFGTGAVSIDTGATLSLASAS